MSRLLRAALLGAIVVAMAAPALAQAGDARPASSTTPMANPPHTAWGAPDLQGFWSNQSVTTLTRGANIPNLVLTPDEATKFESQFTWNVNEQSQKGLVDVNTPPPAGQGAQFATTGYNAFWLDHGRHYATVKGEIRSSWLTDPPNGRLPLKTGGQRGGGNNAGNGGAAYGTYDGPETRPLAERCIISYSRSAGPVMQNSLYNNNYQIVQSPSAVIIDVEMNHDARIIPIVKSKADVKHRPQAIQPWFGDSVGWYEGDTLVVETTNVNPKQNTAQISPKGVLTERFTRWSDGEILYEFSVDDPALYTQVWKGEESLHASKEPLYEYACHEGNYALKGILAGARVQEAQGKTVARNTEVER
ncbi:MAG TPA: hypothetical protein VG942_06475 [Hyphomonadaceae bacterium]|nr:hypothetical protein [Hyphomonadaceae bacterium]